MGKIILTGDGLLHYLLVPIRRITGVGLGEREAAGPAIERDAHVLLPLFFPRGIGWTRDIDLQHIEVMRIVSSFEAQLDGIRFTDRRIAGRRAPKCQGRALRIAQQEAPDPFFDIVFHIKHRARIAKPRLEPKIPDIWHVLLT